MARTTHELANDLLALPDVELIIEGWTGNAEGIISKISAHDSNKAILIPVYPSTTIGPSSFGDAGVVWWERPVIVLNR